MYTNSKKLNCEGIFQDPKDKSIKTVFSKGKNKKDIIEMTYISNKKEQGVDVYCVPTHNYCNLKCKFCHLTVEGQHNMMKPIKSEDFIEALIRTAYKKAPNINLQKKTDFLNKEIKRSKNKKCLLSFMGVGEPLLNLKLIKEVYKQEKLIKKMCDYEEISYAISTIIPCTNINQLIKIIKEKKIPIKLHFSLHSPFSNERKELLPKVKLGVDPCLELLNIYKKNIKKIQKINKNIKEFHKTHSEPIEIHYTLIKNINDTQKHLKKMTELLKKHKIPLKILKFNAPQGLKESKKIKTWLKTLKNEVPMISTTYYEPPGKAIGSSCGEFTKHYYLSNIETEEDINEFNSWKKKHQIFE